MEKKSSNLYSLTLGTFHLDWVTKKKYPSNTPQM